MFGLTLVDHLRLTFGHVIYTHRAHSRLAVRHGWFNRGLLAGEAMGVLVTAMFSIALLQTNYGAYAIATAVTATATVLTLVVRLIFDFEASARTHRVCSAHLWHLREEHRALLADLQDEVISLETARDRRDALMQRLHKVYENGPPIDRTVFEAARAAAPAQHEIALSDEEVDRFLPDSLKKGGKTAA